MPGGATQRDRCVFTRGLKNYGKWERLRVCYVITEQQHGLQQNYYYLIFFL